MTDLFQKHKSLVTVVGGLFILVGIIAVSTSSQNDMRKKLTTPQLIEIAYARGEITDDYRLLYLTYAFFEPKSLPTRFRSNVGWRGTFILQEVYEAASSPEVFCSMSLHARREFQRLLKIKTTCEKETWTSILVGIFVITIIAFVVNIQNRKSQKL